MDNKLICNIDEKIKKFEEVQKEVECLIKSLEQMHQNATNVLEVIKNWEKKNER